MELKFKEPVKGKERIIRLVNINQLEPSPLQRDISDSHAENLAKSIAMIGFLDPVVAYEEYGKYWVVNGQHRLEALKKLGTQGEIPVLVISKDEAKFIIQMNVEKAPNVRDKSIEALKVYKEFLKNYPNLSETEIVDSFGGDICLVTFGICYTTDRYFPASTFYSLIKKIDLPLNQSVEASFNERKKRAEKLLELKQVFQEKKQEFVNAGYDKFTVGNIIMSLANPWKRKRIVEEEFDSAIEILINNISQLNP